MRYPTALDLMKARRSIREFTAEPVPRDAIEAIVEAAYQAPAGSNNRGIWIIVVDDPALKAEIRRRCEPSDEAWILSRPEPLRSRLLGLPGLKREKDYLTICPVLLVVASEVGNPDHPYAHESAWTAIENMCLAATDLGLGTLTYTPEILRTTGQRALHDLFGLPDAKRIQAILPVGRINHAALLPRDPAPDFRPKVFRNRYGRPYFNPFGAPDDAAAL
jgi:iodotyrosine deiodinase